MTDWTRVHNSANQDIAYNVLQLAKNVSGMAALRKLFPQGKADSMNLILFSTSGTHGTYQTIEEEEQNPGTGVTFLIVHPRLVSTRYGIAHPSSPEDFEFLRALRQSSGYPFCFSVPFNTF